MFEQDYLMRIIAQLLGAIRRSMERAAGEEDPDGAARALDMALGDATDLDGEALLSLVPESLASVLQVSGVDPHLTEYIARSLMLSGRYHGEAGRADMAELRRAQGRAVAAAFGHELGSDPVSDEEVRKMELASRRAEGVEVWGCVDNYETAEVVAQLVGARNLILLRFPVSLRI